MSAKPQHSVRDAKYRKTKKNPNQIETQSNNNRHTTHPNIKEQTLAQEDKMNVKKIIPEKKTTFPPFSNQEWKTVNAETEKVNKVLKKISKRTIKQN